MRWNLGRNRDSNDDEGESVYERSYAAANGCLSKLFDSCSDDPRGSVHRAWGVSLIFILVFFVLSITEMVNLQSNAGSKALEIAAAVTGLVHVALGVLGTFVLKRFPTSFSVGFFLGVLVVVANQNLIMFGTFHAYGYGGAGTNRAFANLGLSLFSVLTFFSLLLFHFKRGIVVAPIDAKGLGGGGGNAAGDDGTMTTEYQLEDG